MDFTSSVENIDEVTRQLKVTIPAERVSKELKSALTNLTKNTQLKGFRPGKAPPQLVEQMHGDRIRNDVAQRLISSSIKALLEEHKLDTVGSPVVDALSMEPGKELEFTAKVSLFPRPEIKDYQKPKVKVVRREVKDAEVEKTLEELRLSKSTTQKVENRTTAKKGDVVEGTLSVEVEGTPNADRPEPVVFALGDAKLPKELEEGIIGMSIGESKTIEAKPAEQSDANQKIKGFTFNLSGIQERILPELNDQFATTITEFPAATILELKVKVREHLQSQQEAQKKSDVQLAVVDLLAKENAFQVPQILIDDELSALLVRAGIVPHGSEPTPADLDKFRPGLSEVALKRVRSAILVDRIGEFEKIKAEESEIKAAIADMARKNNVSEEVARSFFLSKDRAIGFLMEITRNKVLNWLGERAEVEYVESEDQLEKK